MAERLPETFLYYDEGKTIGTTHALENILLYYSTDTFEEYNIDPPPTTIDDAWTWDQFVETAKKLTIDSNGNNALHPDFDQENIEMYGVTAPTWLNYWYPFIRNNGGDITNEDGTEFLLNEPKAVDAITKIRDLMHKHFVAPTPTQQADMPATNIAMETQQVAMSVGGQWGINTFAAEGLDFGIGALPKLQEARTMIVSSTTSIFNSTEHPDEALEFLLYHNDPEVVSLFQSGLWMPVHEKYYTDPDYMDIWLNDDVHPKEYKEAVIDYTLDNVWLNVEDPQTALDTIKEKVEPLLEGNYLKQ